MLGFSCLWLYGWLDDWFVGVLLFVDTCLPCRLILVSCVDFSGYGWFNSVVVVLFFSYRLLVMFVFLTGWFLVDCFVTCC